MNDVSRVAGKAATVNAQIVPAGMLDVLSRDEIERLRVIKHLVDEAGINLAGVQRLLEVADVLQRIRPLASGSDLSRASVRRLSQELDRLSAMLGL